MSDWGNVAVCSRFTSTGVDPGFVSCSWGLIRYGLRPGDEVMPPTIGQSGHAAFNNLVTAFLGEERYRRCGALLTLDFDHNFAPETLERLRASADADFDRHPGEHALGALSALYVSRTDNRPLVLELAAGYDWDDPFFTVIPDWRHSGVRDVDLLSYGFTLWRREMLADVGPPWASMENPTWTDDVGLSRRCRLRGWRLGVDTETPIGHLLRVQKWPYESMGAETDGLNGEAG